ncbi:MAG: hypothetical protein V1800_19120 [Candidatus Latescibacterota bacterium]
MKRTHLMIGLAVVLLFPAWAWGSLGIEMTGLGEGVHPDSENYGLGVTPSPFGSLGLLNPERFHMSQSYSMSFASNGKQTSSTGMYLNTLTYQFSMPISVQLQLGYRHDPTMLFGGGGASGQGGLFVPNFDVMIQPIKAMTIQFHYGMVPAQRQWVPTPNPWFSK